MTDVAGYLRKMADDERRLDHSRGLSDMVNALPSRGQIFEGLVNNALQFANAYQVPRDLGASIMGAVANIPGDAYRGMKAHMTGQIPLSGERDREGAVHSLNALSGAGLASPLAGRALQGVASKTSPALIPSWFKGAKQSVGDVTSEAPSQGITAYRGARREFAPGEPFDISRQNSFDRGDGAIFFAENPQHAGRYGPNVRTVNIDDANVFNINKPEHARKLKDYLTTFRNYRNAEADDLISMMKSNEVNYDLFEGDDIQAALRGMKFDGWKFADDAGEASIGMYPSGKVTEPGTGNVLLSDQRGGALPFVDEEE